MHEKFSEIKNNHKLQFAQKKNIHIEYLDRIEYKFNKNRFCFIHCCLGWSIVPGTQWAFNSYLLNKLIDNKDLLSFFKKKITLYPSQCYIAFSFIKPYAINTNMFQTVHLNPWRTFLKCIGSSPKKGIKITNIRLKNTQAKYISGWPTFIRKSDVQKSPFLLDCLTEFHGTFDTSVLPGTLTLKEKKLDNQLCSTYFHSFY